MTGFAITQHAAQRWCERVNPAASPDSAVAEIEAYRPVVERAAAFGCTRVRLGIGARLVLAGSTVVTVLGRDQRFVGGRA